MAQSWIRGIIGVVAFFVVLIVGINLTGSIDFTPDPTTGLIASGNTLVVVVGISLLVGFIAYAAAEYAQTRRFDSITSQFDTRTIVLIPIAIAINIILGQTVAAVLKVPIYLDSIGTILVAVLAGPIAGAVTGALANLIWTYVLPAPFHSDFAAPFFIVAVEIGHQGNVQLSGDGAANGGDATGENRAGSVFKALAAHLFGHAGNQFFGDGLGGFGSRIARTEPGAASGED